jgi:hypothetical protein
MFRSLFAGLFALVVILLATDARAHSASTSYLKIETPRGHDVPLAWRITLRDVDALLDLDANADGKLTWGEVEDRAADIVRLATSAFSVRANDDCPIAFGAPRVESVDGTGYLALAGVARCGEAPASVELSYRLFAGIDPSHRALVTTPETQRPALVAPNGSITVIFAAQTPAATPSSSAKASNAYGFGAMFVEGVGHILSGFDHMLFLVALMLPAVVERKGGRWVARTGLRGAVVQVAWIATAFTLAHSITLGLASFNLARVPAAVIEPLIAATVLATALNNLWPVVTTRLAFASFGFGLIHGFGFAEVLAPLNLPALELARALLAFNLGVEGGQLIVVSASFALLAIARRWQGYPRWILGGGSTALALVAGAWIVERVFNLTLITV